MVFSSVPIYSDHPNWHQLQQLNHQRGSATGNSQLPLPQPPPPPQGGCDSIRPGSMVERARLAKIPQPEAGLKCPRCDSTNTKFCYFNNYSLTQPRHFCKACRRYWTRGGALRNVPVGGGCRRNKRSKNPSSKSQGAAAEHQTGPNSIPKSTESPSSYNSTDMPAYYFPQPSPQLPLMAALQNFSHCGVPNMAGFQTQLAATGGAGEADLGFQIGGGSDQRRLPFLAAGLEPSYPYQNQGAEARPSSNPGFNHQIAPVKMEEKQLGLNLSRQFIGNSENNNYQYSWGGNPWTGLSGVNSSSSTSTHFL